MELEEAWYSYIQFLLYFYGFQSFHMTTNYNVINAKVSNFKFSLTSKMLPSNGLYSETKEKPESWDLLWTSIEQHINAHPLPSFLTWQSPEVLFWQCKAP